MVKEVNKPSEASTSGKPSRRILSVSLAAASLLANATSVLGMPMPVGTVKPDVQVSLSNARRSVPPQLVLRHADQNQQLVAQHDSHSSHSSHSSHDSHSSHSSHGSAL